MIITPAQWQSLERLSFESRLLSVIRQSHPQQSASIPDAELTAEIRRQRTSARSYGMSDDLAAATYVYAAWLMGPDFDRRIPSVHQILAATTLSSAAKTNALNNFVTAVFHTLGDAAGKAA